MRLTIHVKPNAKTTEIVSRSGSEWTIRLHAPPIEGKANEELIRFLAESFDIPKSRVTLLKGAASKTKIVEINE
ncbi:MAG: DUF167 domain-containing protein [Candidatus Uhrbacteria bacterium]|nr:DUF167 domain-containing protein [Candidatus Uhrbacteria bacterium]